MALAKIALATALLFSVSAAPLAGAEPVCVNPDGSLCSVGPNGVSGGIPGGASGSAGWGGASGSIPNGPSGSAWPGGASGCIPGLGCYSVGR
ncbi:hypothetical protein FHT40_002332 [Mycolicibacterium sp. BK556]|uniref:hypothetical protein n=1 Tax=Mycobacteriaceae TaxID=1762 RepID=UPI0018246A2B|nr:MULTISPECIES: hypothetical protein [Mycobacteriaceae]MBB3602699.1 hypothetical protein [Mycolicibacterium sp. BK556]MBB3632451.1 hypothetical protein [Mycolicibacterium sp. BK607]